MIEIRQGVYNGYIRPFGHLFNQPLGVGSNHQAIKISRKYPGRRNMAVSKETLVLVEALSKTNPMV
jgi:hypothetical protein